MEDLFIKYKEYLKNINLSSNSIGAYVNDIDKFLLFLKGLNRDMDEVDKGTILSYFQELKRLEFSSASISRKLIAIRGFYNFLMSIGKCSNNPFIGFRTPKVIKPVPEILSPEEVDRFLSIPDNGGFKEIRDKAMLELMYATGMKVNELINLTVDDINIKLCYTKCLGAKNKERIIPFGNAAAKALEKYLIIRREFDKNKSNLLFLNNYSEKLSRQGFWKIVKYYAKAANIEKEITPSTLRHSFAVHLLENGADLKSIQEFLGHTNMAAIQAYAAITKKGRLLDVYKNSHPRA